VTLSARADKVGSDTVIETGLRTLLLDQPSITGIARPGKAKDVTHDAVFNETAPQGLAPPFVVIRQVDNDPMGTLAETAGLEATTFEIDAHSRSYDDGLQLRKNIDEYLKDYSGNAGPEDKIEAVIMGDKRYENVPEDQGGDQWQHVFTRSFLIQHHAADTAG
jgi:hypothetical protein